MKTCYAWYLPHTKKRSCTNLTLRDPGSQRSVVAALMPGDGTDTSPEDCRRASLERDRDCPGMQRHRRTATGDTRWRQEESYSSHLKKEKKRSKAISPNNIKIYSKAYARKKPNSPQHTRHFNWSQTFPEVSSVSLKNKVKSAVGGKMWTSTPHAHSVSYAWHYNLA